jgi:hypothetical protein
VKLLVAAKFVQRARDFDVQLLLLLWVAKAERVFRLANALQCGFFKLFVQLVPCLAVHGPRVHGLKDMSKEIPRQKAFFMCLTFSLWEPSNWLAELFPHLGT